MKMFRATVILVVILSILTIAAAKGCDGFKIYEIIPETQEQCALLQELSYNEELYDFFTLSRLPQHPARVMVHPNEQKTFLEFLKQHTIAHKLLNENIAETIEREFRMHQRLRHLSPITDNGRLSTDRFYTHDEINAYIDELAQRFPARVFVKQVGKSYEGRSLKTITITNGDGRGNKNVIFVDGGIHAREWISPAAVIYAIGELVENYKENAELLQDYDWVILPVVNPDGYAHTQLSPANRIWRKTRQPLEYQGETCWGADPNRNFDFHWMEKGASAWPCSNTFAGPKAFSEPETRVLRDLLQQLSGRGIMYLTIHSHGKYILYPWGWTSDLPDTWEDLHEVAEAGREAIEDATGTVYTVGSSTNVLYIAAGASDDYAFSVGFPISFTMELPGGGRNGFEPPVEDIDGFVKETWIGIRAMSKKVVEKYPLN